MSSLSLSSDARSLLSGASIEMMPRTTTRIDDLTGLLPKGSTIALAHLDGVNIGDMVATAGRLFNSGYKVMPHIPARLLRSRGELSDWLERYRATAHITDALVLAGNQSSPRGPFSSSMDLLATGALQAAGISHVSVAGHPEGNRQIDPEGGLGNAISALRWKEEYTRNNNLTLSIISQFVFDAKPLLAWERQIRSAGIEAPVRAGLAGPARLDTLLKYAATCGVGASLSTLKAQAHNFSRLVTPHTPVEVIEALASAKRHYPDCNIDGVHLFPLGGIAQSAEVIRHGK